MLAGVGTLRCSHLGCWHRTSCSAVVRKSFFGRVFSHKIKQLLIYQDRFGTDRLGKSETEFSLQVPAACASNGRGALLGGWRCCAAGWGRCSRCSTPCTTTLSVRKRGPFSRVTFT